MLRLEGIRIELGTLRLSADLSFAPGITALIGPSGAGKSTLLATIAGFTPPLAGEVHWDTAPLSGLAPGGRPVSILFQDQTLFPHLNIGQNVGLGIAPNLRLDAGQHKRVAEVLAQVGLAGFEARRPGSLSGGEQSRAALARVLVQDRPVVLLDEPFSALGPALKGEMLDLVRATLSEATVVMVTHDPDDAKRIADATAVLADGTVSAPMETDRLFADPPALLRDYLGR